MSKLPFEKVKREVIVRREAETSEKYSCRPEKRSTDELIEYGIVNIDKPKGPTSHQVSAYVQEILEVNKTGHSGTLDPKVTGVLPVATGRATRIVQLLLTAGKEYVALMHVHEELPEQKIISTIKQFEGRITQLPPVRSAVKRQERERSIYYIDIIEIEGKDVLFKVGCEAGTYIRKLIFDIGKKLGCGAHMVELRRTKAGPFDESTIVTLQDLKDAFHYYKKDNKDKYLRRIIQPVEKAVQHLPKIWVLDSTVDSVCHGANLNNPGIAKLETGISKEDLVAIMTLKDELICYGSAVCPSNEMKKEKGVAVKANKVFMLPGTYPKMQKP